MHEIERHRIILAEVDEKPIVTLGYLVDLLGVSEATIRRDINYLHKQRKLQKVRGGAEAMHPPSRASLVGRPYSVNQSINAKAKRAIARAAVDLCEDGQSIIINGGTTTFFMTEFLRARRMQILTNSFVMAEHLLKHSRNIVTLPGGTVYQEQNIILSPFPNDVSSQFYASKLFLGAQGVSPQGVLEADPLVVQAEMKLMDQAEQRILLIDSTKFQQRTNLILCSLSRIDVVITDAGIDEENVKMLEEAGCQLIVADDMASATEKAPSGAD